VIDVAQLSAPELAAYVATHLAKYNIDVVLVGGTCVSIYTDNQYASYDLDFIEVGGASRKQLAAALAEIGFTENNRYFVNPACQYFLEFPSGPLAIGDQPVTTLQNLKLSTGTFKLLTAEDCIKDRLSAFFHWKDQQALQQAIWVAKRQKYNNKALKQWAKSEGKLSEYMSVVEKAFKNS
jgi:hypothetical protein